MYIDTEASFRPERIVQIAEHHGLDANAVLKNIKFARAYTTDHLFTLVMVAFSLLSEHRYGLVVLDSVISLFRHEYLGPGELKDRQDRIALLLAMLRGAVQNFNVAVLITNQVAVQLFGHDDDDGAAPIIPVGGQVLAKCSDTRLFFQRSGLGVHQRTCQVYKADDRLRLDTTCNFNIGTGGICDDTPTQRYK